jgi:hypothetical protein
VAKALANQPRAKPEIILKNTPNGAELTYNGQLLKLDEMTLNDFEKILGKEHRTSYGTDPFVWDKLGVRAYTRWFKEQADRDRSVIEALTVVTNQMSPLNHRKYQDFELPGNGVHPKKLFAGYLEIDGVEIRKDMTIKELNSKLKTIRSFHCMKISLCGTSIGNMLISIMRDTRGNRYNSLIYDVEFSIY